MTTPAVMAISAQELSQQLHTILHTTDNNERRLTESSVVRALSEPGNLIQLVNVMCDQDTHSSGVRQLAAVLVRKKVYSLWRSLPETAQVELRQLLLQQLGKEPARAVRLAVAHIVTQLAKADASRGGPGWPELYQATRSAAEDLRPEMRELAMVLVYSFAEVFIDQEAFAPTAAETVARGLGDDVLVVRTAAVKAATALLPALASNPTVRMGFLRHVVPQCLQLLQVCGPQVEMAPLCVSVLDFVEGIFEDFSAKRHGDMLAAIAEGLVVVMTNPAVTGRVRENSGSALAELVSRKPKFIVSRGFLTPIVAAAMQIMSEDATISLPESAMLGEDNDDIDDDDLDMFHVQPPCMIGGFLLSSMGTAVSAKAFTAALLPYFSCISADTPAGSAPANPLAKKASIVALACLAEANPSYLRRRVGYVLDIVRQLLADPDPVPREAAGFSMSYFCSHLQPEILTHHAELFPLLTPLLLDENDLVRRRVADALDTLCENVEEDLEPYVDTLLPTVVQSLEKSSLETQRSLCGLTAAMGTTGCQSFRALAPQVLELLKGPFSLTTPETIRLRAQVTETVGVVGAAMGKEAFAPYLPFFMSQVVENLRTSSAALREESFGFLANVCEILRDDFLPFLDDAIACALQTIEEDRGVYLNKHPLASADMEIANALQDSADPSNERNDADEGDDSSDDDDAAEEIHLRVRTADVEEKASAVYCIGVFADVLRGHLGPERVAKCWESLSQLDHYYPSVRTNALTATAKLLKAAHGSAEVVKSFQEDTLNERTRDYLDDLIHQTLLGVLRDETDRSVVVAACEALVIVLNFFGPQGFPFGVDDLVKEVIQLLRNKMPCQLVDDADDPEDSDQEDDEVGNLLNAGEAALTADIMAAFMSGTKPPSLDAIAASAATAGDWKQSVSPAMVVQGVTLPDNHDEEFMEAVAEVVEAAAKAYGPAFDPYARYIFPLLALYADCSSRPTEDVVVATGTIAVMLDCLGPACANYFDDAIQLSFAVINHSDESAARANSCYLIRILVEHCTTRFVDPAAVQQTLQALWTVAGSGVSADGSRSGEVEEVPQAVDNAISATCSMVRCLPAALLPLDSIVPPMLSGIPMKLDKSENHNACSCVVHSLTALAAGTASAPWLPNLAACVANVLLCRTVDTADKEGLVSGGVAPFVAQYSEQWRQARATLNAEQQQALGEVGY